MTPAEWLRRAAAHRPDAPALMLGETVVATYGEWAATAARIAGTLHARGITPGDRVALSLPNSVTYLETLFGIWWAGAVAVPINAKLHPQETAWILHNAGARLVLTDPAGRDQLTAAIAQDATGNGHRPDVIAAPSDDYTAFVQGPPLPRPTTMARDDLAWLFYTSGTTGRPKGVQITCGNLMAMALAYGTDVDTVQPDDAALYAAPLSHGAGLYCFHHVINGCRHVIPPSQGFDPAEILDIAAQVGSITMFAAPTMVRRLSQWAKTNGQTGKGLRTIVYAGAPMYEADILDALDTLGPRFVQIYGQGECPMGITALRRAEITDRTHPRWRHRLGSVGRAQTPVEVAIMAPDGTALPPDTPGEICVRGATVMAGYWQNPTATARTLRDGWLWTGDVGALDADGYLTLLDRSKDVIISGGSNIYPREVEDALLTHPAVDEVAVIGAPDADWGEITVAFVVGQVDTADLDAHCLDRIARFKRPKRYVHCPDLPKNATGKVLKTMLRQRLADGPDAG